MRVSRIPHLPNYTIRKIMRFVLYMFPCRLQHLQMFQVGDKQQSLDFMTEFLIRYDEIYSWFLPILWMDKAHFLLTGTFKF